MEAGKLTHSHSQPGGMDRTPPGTPKKGGKMLAVRVQMLDDTITMFQVQAKAIGKVLFDQVCNQLHLLESDYFGLEYQEVEGTKYWLDLEKPLSRQIGLSLVDTLVKFCVKFYTPDPSQLEEEFTRYLFCLQIKRDLSQGLLLCNNNTAALMASYIVQAECGDYVAEDYPDHRYLSSYKFVPNQDQELERRIMENHKKHMGQSPAEADLNLLETARRCEMYGIKMHPSKDHEGVPINLAVAHMGIVVFQNFTKINTFSWAKMRKISFKKKRFLVKLHPEGYGYYKDTVEFFFEGRNECKNFWKKCVENHGFFRCSTVKKVPRQKTRVLSRGSSFRYSGRTQKQVVDFVRENYVKRQTFQRSQSFRHSSSAHSSVANVGTSISAHPLLPLGDNAVAGTPASLSCGSMTLTSSPLHTADIHAGGSPSPPLTTSVSPGTSVTSSPQHFYPQETPYRRTGHQLTKGKHPRVRSHHAISPLQSPTSAATAASNHSVNLSNNINNNVVVDVNDVKSSRISLKSPDYTNFNDVYSNCYSSLRSLRSNVDNNEMNDNQTKICDFPTEYADPSTDSIRPSTKTSKGAICKKSQDIDKYMWHRSASCKDLYHEDDLMTENKNEINLKKGTKTEMRYDDETPYNIGFDSPITRYDDSKRKCFSAVTSKNPSLDRANDIISDMKIYSSSYPGTTSSLSTESAENEPDDRVIEIIDVKYDSQEDIVLSHDDVSHDSYELLERDSEEHGDESWRGKSRRSTGSNDRARSCSWGSDKGNILLDSRSSENVVNQGYGRVREDGFWSLERERSPKHKSEIDFRSLDRKSTKADKSGGEGYMFGDKPYTSGERSGRGREYFDYGGRRRIEAPRRGKEVEGDIFGTSRLGETGPRILKDYEEREFYRALDQEPKVYRQNKEMELFKEYERKYQDGRKSLEELAVFQMDSEEESLKGTQFRFEERRKVERKREKREKEERFHEGIREKEQMEWEREKERRQMEHRKNMEEKQKHEEEEARKVAPKSNVYANFQEIHPKKFDRVVSNQFGKYSEFLMQQNTCDLLEEERKVVENYEKVCQVGRIAKELERSERNSLMAMGAQKVSSEKVQDVHLVNGEGETKDLTRFQDYSAREQQNGVSSFKSSSKFGKPLVERTKSDPYNTSKNLRRNVLMHQKSIDLTPQQSEEGMSDYDNEDALKKTSRSEHDIPYILHKRHCMNGTAKNASLTLSKTDIKTPFGSKSGRPAQKEVKKSEAKKSEDAFRKYGTDDPKFIKHKPPKADGKQTEVQIINLDIKSDKSPVNIIEPKRSSKSKVPVGKKPPLPESKVQSPKSAAKKENRKIDSPKSAKAVPDKMKEDVVEVHKNSKAEDDDTKEPDYAEVYRGKIIKPGEEETVAKKIPPEPPKRTSSVAQKNAVEVEKTKPNVLSELNVKVPPEPPKRTTSAQKPVIPKSSQAKQESKGLEASSGAKTTDGVEEGKRVKETHQQQTPEEPAKAVRGKQDLPLASSVLQRREESLILFARTRLGLSEGSAFTPIVRQGRVCSPTSQRRTKSLDAPYVSVHRLPPADSFSSKDDTLDGNEGDIVKSAAARAKESLKSDSKKMSPDESDKTSKEKSTQDTTAGVDSEMDSVFQEDVEMEESFKKTVENQSKLDLPFPEEKVLDSVRSKRLLSKIESVDGVDSEGDLDSSKLADPVPIPSDRLVNLPESIRFPSVRQISGQTSEESVDGWDQREVKVKRRTPRRSVGREDADAGVRESVVWDSKDDEPPDDDVWDDNLVFPGKCEASATTDALVPGEYLKRGSCGQSIDDDNLSTPMKESSPEHWVSVDDLPEALEREEKLLRQQEKILREKILNEKLKRELNLDTIDVDERYYDFKDGFRQKYDEESLGLKEKFKGHSLDTYELTEKKLRERGTNKNSSLDEHLLAGKLIKSYIPASALDVSDESSYDNVLKEGKYRTGLDYIQCKVVNDVTEIDQFGDNDDELEEFFVVLDENLGDEKEGTLGWDDENTLRESISKEESLISVPEEFKDDEEDVLSGSHAKELASDDACARKVEIRLSEAEERGKRLMTGEEHILACQLLEKKLKLVESLTEEDAQAKETSKLTSLEESKMTSEAERLSPYSGSRRGSEEHRKPSTCEDTGRLSPYDCSSRRSSDDPRRLSASDDAGRLSPYNDSRRGSEDPRRLSTSEDSRKHSMSESVSEETRRRLSSTEETRRKRASLTKQCSVGADSLSDEMISGIQECSSSFEHDEKDVFETEPPTGKHKESPTKLEEMAGEDSREVKQLEIEVFDDSTPLASKQNEEKLSEASGTHLAPPTSERELSRETEDSVDYGEGDLKDIREAVKEKDISEGLICDNETLKPCAQSSKLPSSFEKSESSDGDELRYIDDKRGSTPEIIVGKSREVVAMSVVVVNEGISVLNKMVEKDRRLNKSAKVQSLPRDKPPDVETGSEDQRHTLPKRMSKPKPLTPKPTDIAHRKLTKAVPNVKMKPISGGATEMSSKEQLNVLKSSLDSSQESDIDKLNDFSLISQVQSQIARRNLSDTGKRLRHDDEFDREYLVKGDVKTPEEEEDVVILKKTSSDERDKTETSSVEMRSSADEVIPPEGGGRKRGKVDKRFSLKAGFETDKARVDKEKRSPDLEKRDSGEDGSSSSSAPPHPKRELSSTWKPFLLESSGSSSLEEGWLPPDDNAHLADEEETSSTSNNQQDDSYHDDIDYPTGVGYPVLNMSSAEMVVGGYGSVYALSRTLSRISERSTSEQERSDIEDDITKPSSHSISVEEESILSSDHQPSLSSDPPSPRESTSRIPDLPDDRPTTECFEASEDKVCEPFGDIIPPPVPDDDWPSPPSTSSVFDTPVVSHVETFYMEIYPEEACKVVVAERHNEGGNSSSDENQTLQEEIEFSHLSSDNISASTTTTTQDGTTVILQTRSRNVRTGSASEDVSVVSNSDRSNSTTAKLRTNSSYGTTEDLSDWTKSSSLQDSGAKDLSDWSNSANRKQSQSCYSICDEAVGSRSEWQSPSRSADSCQGVIYSDWSTTSPLKYHSESYSEQEGQKAKGHCKIKPPKLKSPTGRIIGFFETPVSKVRSPTSQSKFFEARDKGIGYSNLRSPTSHSETTSPKNHGRFFDSPGGPVSYTLESHDHRRSRSPTRGRHECRKEVGASHYGTCTPYYSNVADSAEKSYFGRYDTGSLERTKIHSSRKCCSFYSVSKSARNEEDSSNSEGPPTPSSNTIPRASKKIKRRHRVAMDLEIRNGKIVAPPKTRTTVVENSDSDRSSPREKKKQRKPEKQVV